MKKVGWRVIMDEEVPRFTTLAGSDVSDPFAAWKPWETRTAAEIEHIVDKCPDIASFMPQGPISKPVRPLTCLTLQQLDALIDF